MVFVLSRRNANWQDGRITVFEVKKADLPGRVRFRGFQRVLGQYLNARRLAAAVWQAHRSTKLDIVQASSYMAPGYALLKNGQIPIVCRISSYTPLLRSAYGRQRNLADYLGDWLEVRQVLDADASFAPSFFVANTFAHIEGFKPEVVRSPLELPDQKLDFSFYDAHLGDKVFLLFFGTLSRIKGVDLLAQVIPEVSRLHNNLSFVFVGRDDGLPGGQKMFEYLRSQCYGYEDKLYYWSPLSKAQLYPVIARSQGILMPSRVDNYPNACLEAQSLGIPVVGTDQSSLEEMIVDGKTGFLARNGDAVSIVRAVERLLALTADQYDTMHKDILNYSQVNAAEDHVGKLVNLYERASVHLQTKD